ncbi:uncharacterized protein LOC105163748 [Sesamum indicum]|uniref:Uncharacterized protein LOC105163748 n=1 Tax=Sesamum indicum TaxID=4182 RepID=A0A6I9TCX3_SESIN|nr:uncharacterized protein LOC105163748 [Sesamum indicum]
MEQNLPIIAKKIWKIVRVVYFMLRKGISKGKLFAELSMIMKRGKIAGKAAIQSLMHHHHNHAAASGEESTDRHLSFPDEYEFSCSNSPAYPVFHLNKRKRSRPAEQDLIMAAAMEMINSAAASPALPGFGKSPVVRQLRVTDSPFPLRDIDEDSKHVDEAAEKFIMKFYKDLRQQNSVACLGYS